MTKINCGQISELHNKVNDLVFNNLDYFIYVLFLRDFSYKKYKHTLRTYNFNIFY